MCAISCMRRHVDEFIVIMRASQRLGVLPPQQAVCPCTHAPACTCVPSHCHTHTCTHASSRASTPSMTSQTLAGGSLASLCLPGWDPRAGFWPVPGDSAQEPKGLVCEKQSELLLTYKDTCANTAVFHGWSSQRWAQGELWRFIRQASLSTSILASGHRKPLLLVSPALLWCR